MCRPGPARKRVVLATALAGALAVSPIELRAQEEIRDTEPIPESPRQSLTTIDASFRAPPTQRSVLFPGLRDSLKDTPPFIRDAQFNVVFRSYYRERIRANDQLSEAWAGGGWVSLRTGELFDFLSGGITYYTSQPLYAPLQYDGTELLKTGQKSYGVVGELFAQARFLENNYFIVGRQVIDTPYVNRDDNRMTPNTFFGYTLRGSIGGDNGAPSLRYGAGWVPEIKFKNETEFISMSKQLGATVDRGVFMAGALYTSEHFSIGAINYFSPDIINIAYGEAKYSPDLPWGLQGIISMQYVDQRATGFNLLTGSFFATNQFGVQTQIGTEGAILTLAYTAAGSGANLVRPWSGNPFYTSAMVNQFNRAGEQAVLAGLSYDFGRIGLAGLRASALFVHGWTSVPESGPVPMTESEWDFDLQWRPPWEALKGFSLRARYGFSNMVQAGKPAFGSDLRLIVNYNVAAF